MDRDFINEVRHILNALWLVSWMRGRCWGPKRKNNPYGGSNINLFIGDESVAISQYGEGVIICEFRRTEGTKLGKMVKESLVKAGIKVHNNDFVVKNDERMPRPPYFMWGCEKCKKRGVVEYQEGDDQTIVADHIFEQHADFSPDCDHFSPRIIDDKMVEQLEFEKFFSLTKIS
jgi:hypothetical protein